METLDQIKLALRQLTFFEREAIASWLQELADAQPPGRAVGEPQTAYRTPALPYMTVEEYLEFEEHSPLRHEYINGLVHAMSGVSLAHSRISRDLVIALQNHLRGGPCEAFATDLKLMIRSDSERIYYYPDVMVACQREDWGRDYIRNPKLVAEVLSPSTQHIDRREKAMTYRRVASIEEYVLLSQDEPRIVVQRREQEWRPQIHAGLESAVEFRSVGLSVPLARIYEGTLPATP